MPSGFEGTLSNVWKVVQWIRNVPVDRFEPRILNNIQGNWELSFDSSFVRAVAG
jgi:hypothetical protein